MRRKKFFYSIISAVLIGTFLSSNLNALTVIDVLPVDPILEPLPLPFPFPLPRPNKLDVNKVFMIRDLSVVEDPVRTNDGVWSFASLIKNMAGLNHPTDFVMQWLQHWEKDQSVNGHLIPARPSIRDLVIDPWIKASGGLPLDFSKAPFRLLAIVNRIDLSNVATYGNSSVSAGEGRFVFGVLDPNGNATPFTVIMEFELLAQNNFEILQWILQWEALNTLKFGPLYNKRLEKLTSRFTAAGVAPAKPNGSALNQLRTNEIALAGPWELREFVISPMSGLLTQTTVKQTPPDSLNQAKEIAEFINVNEADILAGRHIVPEKLLGGSSFAPQLWDAPGIRNSEARHLFALQTCNGCHSDETGTFFLHVAPRGKGEASLLSGFLTGTIVSDPVTGTPRVFNDLERRKTLFLTLKNLLGNGTSSVPQLLDGTINIFNGTRIH